MKFTFALEINKPLHEVVKHFEDPKALEYSQKGFKHIEHLSGEKGKAGAQSKFVYDQFDLIETIITNDLPHAFYAKYDHKYMSNTMKVRFESLNDYTTNYISDIEYTKFNGFMMKAMAVLFPGFFKKQVRKFLMKFKEYVENAT